ncbi:hypothetical protein Sa4125_10000 [Aureimonas sp. SA4125]|uniref:FecR domain-containing protein n=1 Tax=Aureimonas sp. SA4125 TaxID=2826993 RepID=UPI001CC6B45B|nr:FecR domain-containing protein [Aureimonas sp. SA4125]BDA83458.1 hypothetical protein Sa4125_10000 [Aureimonas sp. SA4125]
MRIQPRLALGLCLLPALVVPATGQTVGVTAAVNQSARSILPNAPIRTIALGDDVIHNERIETDRVGLLQILLADGTTFTVGPNSALSIDRFVYDPQAGTAQIAATLTKGVFRFIGGKTSKTPGGVSLGTPVGTIGIRGAVVDISLAEQSGGQPTHIDMIFGNDVTLMAPDGQTSRIYEPGYSIVIGTSAGGTQTQTVQKTPPGFSSAIQQTLSGAPGTSGGSPNRPSDETVVASRVADENSDRTPAVNNPPIPLARPDRNPSEVLDGGLIQEAQVDVGRQEVITEVGDGDDHGPTTIPLRVLTAGSTYVTNGGETIGYPGAYGLVGGSSEEDRRVDLTVPASSRTGTGSTNRGPLILPVYGSTQFRPNPILPADGASLGGIPLVGIGYSGVDGFAAYTLAIAGDPSRPFYALAGTPLADPAVLRDGDIRTYSFTPDIIQRLPVPFFSAASIGTEFSGASISDFYLLERPGSNPSSTFLQSWLLITGEGPLQRSAVGVSAGSIQTAGDGSLNVDFGRRGSFRGDPLGFSSHMSGTITSLGLATGGSEIFGRNGENIVLAGDSEDNDYFRDVEVFGGPASTFSTFHVLNLEEEVPRAQFSADRGATRSLGQIRGFAAGLIESYGADNGYIQELGTSGFDPNAFTIDFQAERDTLGGEVQIVSRDGTLATSVAFGTGTGQNSSGGRSAYIDDDLFAAANNGNVARSYFVRDGTRYQQISDVSARTYLVSGDANPQTALLPQGRLCDCKFLEWGWWGTQIRASADPSRPDSESAGTIRSAVHLGAWVGGNIATEAELSALAGTTATYQGSAVGSVSKSVENGLADFVASGSMNMSYDFGARSGALSINDFDGRDFSGAVGGSGLGDALFSGTLSENAGDVIGSTHGAFVNDGAAVAAGVIGNFDLRSQSGEFWEASGVFGGARSPGQ